MANTTMLWRLKVAEGREAEFERLVMQLVRDVHANEPEAVFEYRKTRAAERPEYILFFSFDDAAAFERYSNADWHRGVSPQIMACLDGSPSGEPLDTFAA